MIEKRSKTTGEWKTQGLHKIQRFKDEEKSDLEIKSEKELKRN